MSITVQYEFGNSTPRIVRIATSDLIATVTTAGWLNKTIAEGAIITPNDLLLISYGIGTASHGVNLFTLTVAGGIYTVVIEDGQVILPVVSGDFANFSGTSGAISDAGFSPSDASKTKVVMAGSAVVSTRIAKFIDTTGTVDDTAGTATNVGSIQAGISATAGTFISFPSTAANGTLIVAAVNAGGAFNTTISNGTMAQSTVYSIPDVTAATGQFLVKTAALVSGNVVKASGTGGVIVDAGFALHAGTTAAYAGGGTSNAFTTTNMTSASIVTATILAQTNAATIVKAVPGTNTLTVTFSADPGANTTVNWISTTAVA